jgi:hypothetical protein
MPNRAAPSAVEATAGLLPSEEELRPETDPETGIDLSLIRENLKLTPWERLLANDDTVNFCDLARAALKDRHAAANPIAGQTDRG